MEFHPIYYRERLQIINQYGDIGIATLWTPPSRVIGLLGKLGIDLTPETSRVAVIANFYGKGLPELLRNLLWNPQITQLIVLGQDLSGSRDDLVAFFEHGIEPTLFVDTKAFRIKGRRRIIDGLVTNDCFLSPIRVTALGTVTAPETALALSDYFVNLAPPPPPPEEDERLYVPIPENKVTRFPSEPRSHTIVRASPLEAWLELIFRLYRFGYWVTLEKGQRKELQNVHVVVTEPADDPAEALARFGFTLEGQEGSLRRYQTAILDPSNPEDPSPLDGDTRPTRYYTYGHRMRAYFGKDNLAAIVAELKRHPESRHTYLTLWDAVRDLEPGATSPCLVSLFFRRFDDKLTLTATFRTHNARNAWLVNLYGLMAVQRHVASQVDLPVGPITVISHSISIQQGDLEEAASIVKSRKSDDTLYFKTGKSSLREDPNGYFTVAIDPEKAEIILEHIHDGMSLAKYRGKTAKEIHVQLERDTAISLVSHALYIGDQLARAEARLPTRPTQQPQEAAL